jgi:hypothetical protein
MYVCSGYHQHMGFRRSETGKTLARRTPSWKIADATSLESKGWPQGYFQSFVGVSEDFERPPQGELEEREKFD